MDRRAERILLNRYWGPLGWQAASTILDPGDFAYAAEAGYMFDDVVMGHGELVRQIADLAGQVSLAGASDAFLASLSRRWLFLRPFLPSLIVARSMPEHSFEQVVYRTPDGRELMGDCAICHWGREPAVIDRSIMNFERHKWGGIRHLALEFIWFCLDRLRTEGGVRPVAADIELFQRIIDTLRACPAKTTLTQASSLLRFVKGNASERLALLEALSVIGVLEDPAHPGFLRDFIVPADRGLPAQHFADRGYPGAWWTSEHGVNSEAVRELFPQFSSSDGRLRLSEV